MMQCSAEGSSAPVQWAQKKEGGTFVDCFIFSPHYINPVSFKEKSGSL